MFDFFNSIGNYLDVAAKFLFGEDRAPGGTDSQDRGLLGSLGDSFLKTTEGTASARRQEEQIRMDVPTLSTRARASVRQTPQSNTFVGSRNDRLLSAMRRDVNSIRNPQFQTLLAQRTLQGGRRTVGLGTVQVPGATQAKAASVRTSPKDIEV